MTLSGPFTKRMEKLRKQWRTMGYDDGYAGKPARYTVVEYQTAYRLGRQARADSQPGKDVA